MTPEELPANPMQPYIDHIRSMGVKGRVAVWCSASEHGRVGSYLHWTAFVGDEEIQFNASSFSGLVQAISAEYLSQFAADPIALGM